MELIMKLLRKGLAVSSLSGVSLSASAALPEAATTAFTNLQTDGLALINAAWPVVGAIVVGFVLIKLFRRAANKV
jgi:hypothetical protein